MNLTKKQDKRIWTGFSWLRIGSSGRTCEHNNESFVPIRDENLLTNRVTISFLRRILLLGVGFLSKGMNLSFSIILKAAFMPDCKLHERRVCYICDYRTCLSN
jgi:hypothetical protein